MSLAEDLKADFRNYLAYAWHHHGHEAPTWLQDDLAWWLQHGPAKLCVLCFRNFGKSWELASFGNWAVYRDLQEQILYTSASQQKAQNATTYMLQQLREQPATRHLVPTHGMRRSTMGFDVAGAPNRQEPSIRSLGITSNAVTGGRATKIFPDDIETPENSLTLTMQMRIREKIKELGGAVLRSSEEVADAKIVYLGTPQIEDSMYFELEEKGYRILTYPARFPTPEQRQEYISEYGDRLAPIIAKKLEENPELAGQPTEPTRFPERVLLEREKEYGRQGFQLQFMLLPGKATKDRYPLRIDDLVVMGLDPRGAQENVIWGSTEDLAIKDLVCTGFRRNRWHRPAWIKGDFREYEDIVLAIDPSSDKGEDELGYAVVARIHDTLYLLEVGGYLRGGTPETLGALAATAKRWGVKQVLEEGNFGGGLWGKVFAPHLRKVHPDCPIELVHVTGQKERRIISLLEPVISSHRLVVNETCITQDYETAQRYARDGRSYSCFYQMARITHDKQSLLHDDRLDALSLAVGHFQDAMALDRDQRIEDLQAEALEAELEKFVDSISGHDSPDSNWMDLR